MYWCVLEGNPNILEQMKTYNASYHGYQIGYLSLQVCQLVPRLYVRVKLWFKMKSTKLYSKILLVKISENNFIFLPVLKAPKNFGKIAILKIWELVFLGVKTH